MASVPLLRLDSVTFRYGAVTVTDDVSITVEAGTAVGIIGPNGAGKSTLLDLINGVKRPASGQVFLNGADISQLPASRRCSLGIARSFQIPRPFTGMTVFENLLVGATMGARLSMREAKKRCAGILDQTHLSHLADFPAGRLRLLDRKRLELARALSAEPKLLLLDEVAGGLSDAECGDLLLTIKAAAARGVTIIWIEHVVHALMAVVERILVLHQGALLLDGPPQAVMADPKVRQIYLGLAA